MAGHKPAILLLQAEVSPAFLQPAILQVTHLSIEPQRNKTFAETSTTSPASAIANHALWPIRDMPPSAQTPPPAPSTST